MAEDVDISLSDILVTTEFSIKIEESILQSNDALLLVYVKLVKKEMLFTRTLIADTKSKSIFNIVKD